MALIVSRLLILKVGMMFKVGVAFVTHDSTFSLFFFFVSFLSAVVIKCLSFQNNVFFLYILVLEGSFLNSIYLIAKVFSDRLLKIKDKNSLVF